MTLDGFGQNRPPDGMKRRPVPNRVEKEMQAHMVRLGERMRHARLSFGVTQKVAAEQLGLSTAALGHIERGVHRTSLPVVYRMAKVYQRSTAWFFDCGPLPKLNCQRGWHEYDYESVLRERGRGWRGE